MNKNIILEQLTGNRGSTRRQVLKSLGAGAAGLAGLRMLSGTASAANFGSNATDDVNVDVVQFALNLEYLEAEYYLYATTGQGLSGADIGGAGIKGQTTIKSNPMVPFQTQLFKQYAQELASDEQNHVEFLRATLESLGIEPIARPPLDLLNSWNTLAQAAGIGSSFDPFENEVNFLLGSFVFEDVGVTAYRGGARLLTNPEILFYAAGILGTEAYHGGNLRGTLLSLNDQTVIDTAQKISDLRDALDGPKDDDQGITLAGSANTSLTDPTGLVYARHPRQVLNIVYGKVGASRGLFYPEGLNGAIK